MRLPERLVSAACRVFLPATLVTLGATTLPANAATLPTSPTQALAGVTASATPPAYDHVVLAIFENHEQSQIIGASNAPYLTSLAGQGANFTQSYAIQHPSQPNYLDLFSGSNQGVNDDSCPHTFSSDNVGHQLIGAGKTFAGYSEDLPSAGSSTCSSGNYARKHAPWTNFSDLDQSNVNLPYTSFPSDFSSLPTYSWVVPNLCNDMHNCPVSTGDTWARNNLDAYAQWAKTHNSLLIVTFDEDDSGGTNQIPTLFIGAHVTPGNYSEHIDHFSVLRTIEAMYGLPALGSAASRTPITDVFGSSLVDGGSYTIGRTGTSQVIDDPAASTTEAQQMIVWPKDGGSNQSWIATATGSGTYTFKNGASGQCLDDSGSSVAAGSPIIQWPCTGVTNQQWTLVPSGSGYELINKASGLAVTPNGTAYGSALTQQAAGQAWTFAAVSSTASGATSRPALRHTSAVKRQQAHG